MMIFEKKNNIMLKIIIGETEVEKGDEVERCKCDF